MPKLCAADAPTHLPFFRARNGYNIVNAPTLDEGAHNSDDKFRPGFIMAIRKILTMDKPVLRAKAKKVSRFDAYLEKLVNDMWETVRAAPGVGLAAPQIGESIRVLVAEYEDEHVALVNPEIIKRSEEEVLGTEGCLSIPGYVGDDVPRAKSVTVKARDPHGKEIRIKAEDWFARILQHEIDHLDGVLYIDHIAPNKVREIEPDEIADEAEVHHEPVKETVAGASEPVKRPRPIKNEAGGANGKKATDGKRSGDVERVGSAGGRG